MADAADTKETKVMRSFEADEEEYLKFKSTLAKDGKDVGKTINKFIKKFNLEFGDGNPAYNLDIFMDNSQMLAIPAVMRVADDWWEWLTNCKDPKIIQSILWQAQMIGARSNKRLHQLD